MAGADRSQTKMLVIGGYTDDELAEMHETR
jgi:hypothetical protein